jgi:hypothetical protein
MTARDVLELIFAALVLASPWLANWFRAHQHPEAARVLEAFIQTVRQDRTGNAAAALEEHAEKLGCEDHPAVKRAVK